MRSFLLMLPVIIVLVTLIYSVVRHIGRLWLDHRVKMALLEKLERKPELLHSYEDLQSFVEGSSADQESTESVDFALTGLLLAVIGVICVVLYATVGQGRWAVGAYWGGVACVALGFLLAILGVVVRFLTRTPIGHPFGKNEPRRR